MKVMCEKHPELHVFDLGVKFSKGLTEVEDADKLRQLSDMNGFGFTFEEEIPAPEPSNDFSEQEAEKKPRGGGKKADDEQGGTD